jgi:hypothetical protein
MLAGILRDSSHTAADYQWDRAELVPPCPCIFPGDYSQTYRENSFPIIMTLGKLVNKGIEEGPGP